MLPSLQLKLSSLENRLVSVLSERFWRELGLPGVVVLFAQPPSGIQASKSSNAGRKAGDSGSPL